MGLLSLCLVSLHYFILFVFFQFLCSLWVCFLLGVIPIVDCFPISQGYASPLDERDPAPRVAHQLAQSFFFCISFSRFFFIHFFLSLLNFSFFTSPFLIQKPIKSTGAMSCDAQTSSAPLPAFSSNMSNKVA